MDVERACEVCGAPDHPLYPMINPDNCVVLVCQKCRPTPRHTVLNTIVLVASLLLWFGAFVLYWCATPE